LHEILELIEDQMIVVLSEEQERIGSEDLYGRLNDMDRRVNDHNDRHYCESPSPAPRSIKKRLPVDANLHVDAKNEIRDRKPKLHVYRGETRPSMTPQELREMGE
jgi:hypothetical protein